MRAVSAVDYAGRFIGARDTATGRFVPDAMLKRAAREARRVVPVVGYVSDPEEMATVPGRSYRSETGKYEQNGESVTRSTRLDTRGAGEIRVGRATFGDGRMMARSDARTLGAMSAPSVRASGDQIARMLKRDKQDRRVRTTTVDPATLAAMRAARGLSPLAIAS